jgi:hypothetical protein
MELVSIHEAARATGRSTDAVRKLVQRHRVPVHSTNGYNVRVPRWPRFSESPSRSSDGRANRLSGRVQTLKVARRSRSS